jgi:hypothetical protein
MPKQFATHVTTLGQLFSNPNIIQTPPFQRSFSWTREDASRFIDEIESAFQAETHGDGCFLGPMLFLEPEKSSSFLGSWPRVRNQRVFEVVDGLQRLTTLTILFSLLRDLDARDGQRAHERVLAAISTSQGRHAQPRVAFRGPDEPFFQACVRDPGGALLTMQSESLSASEERLIEVRECLHEIADAYAPPARRRLADYLLDECFVVVMSTTGVDRAHRLFTVLNTAGRPLGRNDILKAHVLADVKPSNAERVTAIWDDAEKRLGKEFENLFTHIRAIHGRTSPDIISAVRTIAARAGGGQTFVEKILQPSAAACDAILRAEHVGSPHSAAIRASLTYLSWMKGNVDWVPPALHCWLDASHDPAALAAFLRALERLSYLLRIQGRGNQRRLTRMRAVLGAVRNGQDLASPTSPLNVAREELRMVHHSLRDLHKRHAQVAKLVLLRLNDVLAGQPQNLDADDLTVEHLLPRKPGVNSPWRALFPDPADRERCAESLGNLVLVSKVQNDRAGNLDFARKREVLFGPGPQLPINEFVSRQSQWTAQEIETREAELLQILDQIWQIGPAPGRRAAPAAGDVTPPSRRRKEPQAASA